jgi:hypothetical protein
LVGLRVVAEILGEVEAKGEAMAVNLLEAPSSLSTSQRGRRAAWLVAITVALVVVAVVAFALARLSAPVPSAPIFATGDGLPRALVAGDPYTAELSIAIPADGSTPKALNEHLPVIVSATLATTPDALDASILCAARCHRATS